jgi:Mut7-C RNAse domain-containing protein
VHPVRLFGEAADRVDSAVQFLLRVQVAEALGGADVRLLVGLGVVAVEADDGERTRRRDNAPLELADLRLLDSLPVRIRALGSTVHVCPQCGQLYWDGSHVRRMRRRLQKFAQGEESGNAD